MKLMKQNAELQVGNYNQGNWMDFHLALIELRIEKGITQAEMAKKLGISQPAVSQFEKLTSTPNLGTVFAYAMALGAKINFSIEN